MVSKVAGMNAAIELWSPKWDPIIKTEKGRKTFHDHGYYSQYMELKDYNQSGDVPKTKIISLNTVFCYGQNFEQFAMFSDPGNMVQWLQDELSDLEEKGELAIVLSHVPNDDGCMRMLGKRLHAVFDRY